MKNTDDLKGLGFAGINEQIRIDQKEMVAFVGQLFAPMTSRA